MKKVFRITFLCIVLCCACLLASCKTPTLEQEDGGFRNPQTDIFYYSTSPNYFARPVEGDPYAKIKIDGSDTDILLYEIAGVDPERYLVSNDYRVYAAKGSPLPELYNLPCVRVGIYDTQVSSNDGNITDAEGILALKELHKTGSYVNQNTIGFYIQFNSKNWYDLHFMGDGDYKGVYYQLKYGVFNTDVIVIDFLQRDANGEIIDLYPGVPYEIYQEEYNGKMYDAIKYNFGREILCDTATGNCYKIENSLLPYLAPIGE